MRYGVKEVFATLQGEGLRVGTKAVFVRFSGCNLWSGLPAQRALGAGPCAQWCDTDFFKGEVIALDDLVTAIELAWDASGGGEEKWVVLTGGEPCLQVDRALMVGLIDRGWRIAVETNGTVPNLPVVQLAAHICVAPKRRTSWEVLGRATEIKVVVPGEMLGQPGWSDEELESVARWADTLDAPVALFVQPQDVIDASSVDVSLLRLTHSHGSGLRRGLGVEDRPEPDPAAEAIYQAHVERAAVFVMRHPRWRLSLQTHKYIDLP